MIVKRQCTTRARDKVRGRVRARVTVSVSFRNGRKKRE